MNKKTIFFNFILVVFFIFGFSLSQGRDSKEKALNYQIGDKIENLQFEFLENGKMIKMEDLKGKKVFLNFTATWCPDSLREKAQMEEDYEKLKSMDNIKFIIIFGPYGSDTKEKVIEYMKEHNYKVPVYYDTNKTMAKTFGLKNYPTSFLIDENGVVEDINVESGYRNMKYFK